MKSNLEQAKEFRKAYNIGNSPSMPVKTYQLGLIIEEFKEFLEAERMLYRKSEKIHADCLKELGDLVYVCYQYSVNMGWDLDRALERIHQSNLSKLDEQGNPIKREDGKVLKGPNYKEPYLEDLI
tara:strand:+ start:872 stop:1246 length:375 start_codon:yes stop_codon:yes gene_type:complete